MKVFDPLQTDRWCTALPKKKNLQLIYPTRNTVGTHNKIWSHNQAKSVCNLRLNNTYLSSVSNDSITYTHPDRKLGILCMKYFAGVGGVNGLLNEASLPEFIMKISEERQNYCILTCRPSRDIYKHACAHTHAHTHTHTHTHIQEWWHHWAKAGKCLRCWYSGENKTNRNLLRCEIL